MKITKVKLGNLLMMSDASTFQSYRQRGHNERNKGGHQGGSSFTVNTSPQRARYILSTTPVMSGGQRPSSCRVHDLLPLFRRLRILALRFVHTRILVPIIVHRFAACRICR